MEYRVIFSKTGNVKYISHLDVNRCMLRAIRRSGLPAWYTEGFHPHMYLMFALALSLGAESNCEIMDMRLTEELPAEEIKARMNAVLPEGMQVQDVRQPKHTAAQIGSAQYRVVLSAQDAQALARNWEVFAAQPEILVEKRTKRGRKEMDIHPMLQVLSTEIQDEKLELLLRLPAGNTGNLNVSVVMDAFQKHAEQPFLVERTLREKIFCLDGEEFL